MQYHILLDTNGIILKKKNHRFWIVSKQDRKLVSPKKVESITMGAECLISTSAVSLAAEHQIPIYYKNRVGNVFATVNAKNQPAAMLLRRKQIYFTYTKAAVTWITQNLMYKSQNQSAFIQQYLKPSDQVAGFINHEIEYIRNLQVIQDEYDGYIDIQGILNLEANFSRIYWAAFRSVLPDGWSMQSRNERPAIDPVNASLHYFYGFLYKIVEHSVWINGLNPYEALLHQQQYKAPVLTFDLIEPFRPFIDEWLMSLFTSGAIEIGFYDIQGKAFYVNRKGKKKLVPLFYEYMDTVVQWRGEKTSIKNQVYRYVNELKEEINKINIHDFIHQL